MRSQNMNKNLFLYDKQFIVVFGDINMTDIKNKDEFLKALDNTGIQVMMFTAFWCPDCMYIKPFLPEIEEEFSNLQFYSLNRDHCMDIAVEYEVMGIPSFICFKDGKEISRFVSTLRKTKEEIEAFLTKTIESEKEKC